MSFGTIQNNTTLKQVDQILKEIRGFGTIQNNTTLKHIGDEVNE